MLPRAMRRVLLAGLLVLACSSSAAEPPAAPGRWEDLKVPGGNVAMDPGGRLWVCSSEGLRYWNGKRFSPPTLNEMSDAREGGTPRLYGDPAVGAFALRYAGNEGHAYRLSDGKVRLATDFYYDGLPAGPGFCVSRAGVMINYGRRFLATRRDGRWERIEARLGKYPALALTPRHAVFAAPGWVYIVDDLGRIKELEVPSLRPRNTNYYHVSAWPGADENVYLSNGENTAAYVLDPDTLDLTPRAMFGPHQTAPPDAPFMVRAADGSLKPADVSPGALSPGWLSPRPTDIGLRLAASDGSCWTAFRSGEVTRYKDGKLTLYDWRNGPMPSNPYQIVEGKDGQVFLCSSATIDLFLPGREPAPQPAWHALWQEHRLASRSFVVQDSEGRLWMRLWDRPLEASVWDGHEWHTRPLPGDVEHLKPVLTDEHGRVFFAGSSSTSHVFALSMDESEEFADVRDMLASLAGRGVRVWWPVDGGMPCIALPDGRMWHGRDYYDGVDWTDFGGVSSARLFESPRYGVLFGREGSPRFSIYDRGQFATLRAQPGNEVVYLLGPEGIQPFERKLLGLHVGRYVPVVRTPDNRFHLLRDAPPREEVLLSLFALGDELPSDRVRLGRGMPPVHYLTASGRPTHAFVQGRVFPLDFTSTPLEHLSGGARQIFVDPTLEPWFVHSGSVFVKSTGELRITVGAVPRAVGAALTLDVRLEEPGLEAGEGLVFWRLNGGRYQGGAPPGRVRMVFAEAGEYNIEMIGVDPQGVVTAQPLKLTVRATSATEEPHRTAGGPPPERTVAALPGPGTRGVSR